VQRHFSLEALHRVRDRHQAAQHQTWQRSHRARQRQHIARLSTRFGGPAIRIHLQTHLQRRQVPGPLVRQALRDLEPIHAVYPVKMLGHQTGLVALDRADAVPLQRQIMQGGDLVHRLLDVVFAKSRLACGMGLAHRLGTKGLGHGQQAHAGGRAARRITGCPDAVTHRLKVFGNGAHVPETTKAAPPCC